MVGRVQIERFLQVGVGQVDLPSLHARSRPVDIVLRIVGEKVDSSAEFNLGSLVVLLVEALSTEGVMGQREACFDESWLTAEVQGVMII